MRKKILSLLQYVVFLGLGIFLVWWSIHKISPEDWAGIKKAVANARYWLIVPVMCSLLLSHYSRARRWKILIEPLGHSPRIANTYMAVLIGYLANLAVPRLGEVLKCTILARYEKVPADKLVGTIVAERAFDVLCLGIVILITVLTQFHIIGNYISGILDELIKSKAAQFTPTKIILLVLILLAVIAGTIIVLKKFAHVRFIQKIKIILLDIWQGIISVRYVKKKGWFIFHSILIWSMYLLSVQLGMFALRETSGYGLPQSLSALTTGSLAMIVPTPGGIGVYPYFIQKTMVVYGLRESLGLAFGLVLWSVQFFLMLVAGFVALILLPYYNKKPQPQPQPHAQS